MPAPTVVVRPAAVADWPALERLVQLYLHDLSSSRGYLPRPDGTFAFPALPSFRPDSPEAAGTGRRAWVVEQGEQLAGFALTRPWERGGTSLVGFFVVRGLRRTGVGLAAALALLPQVPGAWGIAFQTYNPGAGPFWRRVATAAVGDAWTEETGTGPEGAPPDVWVRLHTRDLLAPGGRAAVRGTAAPPPPAHP